MNGHKKSMVVTLLAATALWPRLSSAMEIQQFDRMAKEDQQHYLAFLVKEAQKLLIEQGRRDQAVGVSHLFQDIPPGEDRSVGEAQFELELAAARAYSANVNMPGKVSWNQVDFVLFQTLFKNGIRPSPAFYQRFQEVTRNRVFYQAPKK
jgi:hypothetical protein